MERNILIVMSEVATVRGYNRGILYDFPRDNFTFVPNELIDFIDSFHLKSIENLNDTNMKYLDFLLEHEYAILTSSKLSEGFIKIDTQWDVPYLYQSCHLTVFGLDELLKISIDKLGKVKCYNALIVFRELNTHDELLELVKIINDSKLRMVSLVIENFNDQPIEIEKNPKIQSIVLLNRNFEEVKESIENKNSIYTLFDFDAEVLFSKMWRKPQSFTLDLKLFNESLHYNTYFNGKIFIDEKGNVKNGLSNNSSNFGNISSISVDTLKELAENELFTKYKFAKKDLIEVCNVCEFRHMCIDNRTPHLLTSNHWIHEVECEYNPFINKWVGDEEYLTLSEIGVISENGELKINSHKIELINSRLWDLEFNK